MRSLALRPLASLAVRALSTLVCFLCLTLCGATAAHAQTANEDVYGVTYETNGTNPRLLRFNRATPGTTTFIGTITGTSNGGSPRISSLDFRPATQQLYATAGTNLYIIPLAATGTDVNGIPTVAATFVGNFGVFNHSDFNLGADFNPVADHLRLVSTNRSNARLNPANAAQTPDTLLTYAAGDINASFTPSIGATAYSNNTSGATTTTAYGIDQARKTLVTIGTVGGTESPDTGLVHTVASLTDANGGALISTGFLTNLDIAPDGTAYLLISGGNFYTVNLATGVCTLTGTVDRQGASFLAAFSITTLPVCTAPPTGMTAWYPGDGNFKDIQGGNNAAPQGGMGFTTGKVAQAFNFDGTDDALQFGSAVGQFGTSNFTVDFWIKTTSARAEEVLNNRYSCSHGSFLSIRKRATGDLGVELDGDGAGTGYVNVSSTGSVSDGAFHHIAVVRQGTTLSLYVDGALNQSNTAADGQIANINSGPLRAGTGSCAEFGANNFTGQLDEIEIFNRALAQTEIQAIVTADGAGKCKGAVTNGAVLVSEFRFQGATSGDEFVEIYNNTNAAINVNGFSVVINGTSVPLTNTSIPARGHYLLTGPAYSLADYGGTGAAAGDTSYATDNPADSSVAVLNASGQTLDKVGFTTNAAGSCEGTCLTPTSATGQYSFLRNMSSGKPQDTDNNVADFVTVSTNPTTGSGARLGAPGPENLASPIDRSAQMSLTPVAPCVSSASAPNRVRDFTSDPANNSQFGTLKIRRTVTNNTGASVTRLRFRAINITAGPAPSGTADLRIRSSADDTFTNSCAGGATASQGLTHEQPPNQPNGGGLNSSLSLASVTPPAAVAPVTNGATIGSEDSPVLLGAPTTNDTITLGTPLANGSSLTVNFLLGIQQTGTFRFYVIIEVLP